MKVHIIDEEKSTEDLLKPLCGKFLMNEKGKQFLTSKNNTHIVDCKECLDKLTRGK